MATEQESLKFYLPADEAERFRQNAAAEDRTITAVLRRLVREYNEQRSEAQAAAA